MLEAPLEQFQILVLLPIKIFSFDFSITNFLLINLLSLLSFQVFMSYNSLNKGYSQKVSSYFVPNSWQNVTEFVSELPTQIISDIILKKNKKYFPIISVLLNYILCNNLIGLIPYSFTPTSHLIITFVLSFSVFLGINTITLKKYQLKIFSAFLPTGTTFFLALLLTPIEFISYVAKLISLGTQFNSFIFFIRIDFLRLILFLYYNVSVITLIPSFFGIRHLKTGIISIFTSYKQKPWL